jgi:hypothetical protein
MAASLALPAIHRQLESVERYSWGAKYALGWCWVGADRRVSSRENRSARRRDRMKSILKQAFR